jgi:predicted nucleic acid-binding protein
VVLDTGPLLGYLNPRDQWHTSLAPSLHALAVRLMRDYATTPMDYADASLVTLASALGLRRVFTTDRRGFTVYRVGGGKRFEPVG